MTAQSPDGLRLRSVIEGRLLAGPETLQVNLQNACNLDCDFCWNHSPHVRRPSAAWQRARLSAAHLDAVIEALPGLRPGRVLLSGRGEPLLHPEVERLLGALAALGIPVTIQTNGVAGPSPERLVELGVDRLLVNVSAGTPEDYEAVHTGRGHLFEAVVSRLSRLRELGGRSGRPEVVLAAIVHEGNAGTVASVVELAARVGATGVFLKGMEHRDEQLRHLMLTPAGRERVRAGLSRARALAEAHGISLDDVHLAQVAAAQGPEGSFTDDVAGGACYMGWYYLRVTCDGRVMFCCKDKQVDHLDRRELLRIWRSPAYHLWRLAGRDRDPDVGLLDERCRACSNFARNLEVHRALEAARTTAVT